VIMIERDRMGALDMMIDDRIIGIKIKETLNHELSSSAELKIGNLSILTERYNYMYE
jgi:hypothetical protein